MKFSISFAVILSLGVVQAGRTNSFEKSEHERLLHRQKRFLIFPGGGTAKFVAGYLGPIQTEAFINCNAIRNFQYQYDLPPNITTIYSVVPGRQRSFGGGEPTFVPDSSRKIAYEVVEQIMSKEGKNGRECLLRSICEVAETPVNHNGLVGELLQLFFTPGRHEKLHDDYRLARKAGLNNVNCEKLYPKCPFGHGILDSISLMKEYGFDKWMSF